MGIIDFLGSIPVNANLRVQNAVLEKSLLDMRTQLDLLIAQLAAAKSCNSQVAAKLEIANLAPSSIQSEQERHERLNYDPLENLKK